MTTRRYRRSSVRAVIDRATQDPRAAAEAHDALWAALWNRRYDDVDEPVRSAEVVHAGMLAFWRAFPGGQTLAGIDTGDAFTVFLGLTDPPPIGSFVRVLAAGPREWRFGDGTRTLGLGIALRFDEPGKLADATWTAALRDALHAVRAALDARREQLAARRASLGARSEPSSLEAIWRDEVAAISERVTAETDFTAAERAALDFLRGKRSPAAEETERKIHAARRNRFTERGNAEIARFREERWPAIRDAASDEIRKYAEYRTGVVALEDGLLHVRAQAERATKAAPLLDAIAAAGFHVDRIHVAPERAAEPGYDEEVLRTIELLHAAIPRRAPIAAMNFSAYRAPTAGPSVTPPRV